MRVVTEFPRPIHEIENVWIPMSDGARLSARLRLPVDAEHLRPVPAILEYIPYRKDDHYLVVLQDPVRHNYFAGHGYASVRVDLRGSGPSDGILYDEYLKQEQDDALEVIDWIARQPWCTGAVGMMGISWGGFNSLQVAARRPPALKCIISIMGTDDRYALDVHYMGGCLLAFDMPWWATTMLAYNARPVDPFYAGEGWREKWLDRMERTPPFLHAWMSHQRRDAFWKHGSVRENYADIECPVYAVVGWADVYPDAKLRLLEGLTAPRKGLFGPWGHQYPEVATPGPAIGFLQESLRWWDHWLKGIDTGIMDEPMLRAYVLESPQVPGAFGETWPGRWIAEPSWPPPEGHLRPRDYYLGNETLEAAPGPDLRFDHHSPQFAGLETGSITAYGTASEFAPDQRAEDGLSLCFTSPPLDERIEFIGFPEATLTLAVDRPIALVAARLCDVAPTGESTLISRGMLNLTHRDSDEEPAPLEPGRRYTVRIPLKSVAYAMPPGHRLRIGLTATHWPHLWPSPEPVTLTVFAGAGSRLTLPVRPPRPEDDDLKPFLEPEGAAPWPVEMLRNPSRNRRVARDSVTRRAEVVDFQDYGHRRILGNGLEYESTRHVVSSIVEGEPLSAEVRCDYNIRYRRGDWRTHVHATCRLTSRKETFHLTNTLDAYEGNERVFGKTWDLTVPRDHM